MEFQIASESNYTDALVYLVESTDYYFSNADEEQTFDFSLENYDTQNEKEIRAIMSKFGAKELDDFGY